MQEPYRKGSSESILTSSLAGDIARCLLKRRQRHRWAGRLSCEKPVDQDADFIPSGRKAENGHWQIANPAASESARLRIENRRGCRILRDHFQAGLRIARDAKR